MFYDILERENAFLDYENTQVKKKKKKLAIFSCNYFREKVTREMCFTILWRGKTPL